MVLSWILNQDKRNLNAKRNSGPELDSYQDNIISKPKRDGGPKFDSHP